MNVFGEMKISNHFDVSFEHEFHSKLQKSGLCQFDPGKGNCSPRYHLKKKKIKKMKKLIFHDGLIQVARNIEKIA